MPLQHELLKQLTRIADALERAYPKEPDQQLDPDVIAFQWQYRLTQGGRKAVLLPVPNPGLISFDQLKSVDRQKKLIRQNTIQFLEGKPANNVLLTGSRGTGKSSLVKACLHEFHCQGLRLVEVDKENIGDLPEVIDILSGQQGKFILFCDDLSFEEGDIGYKRLKTALDGSIAGQATNILIYATSNRRHLIAERMSDNLNMTRGADNRLHPSGSGSGYPSMAFRPMNILKPSGIGLKSTGYRMRRMKRRSYMQTAGQPREAPVPDVLRRNLPVIMPDNFPALCHCKAPTGNAR